jgi:flagellar motor switch protein FliG
MVILGEETSAQVLRELDEEEVQQIGREIAAISDVSSEMAEDILTEFYQMLVARVYMLKGGIDYARKLLVNAFGSDQARYLLDQVARAAIDDSETLNSLRKTDPEQLANLVQREHPQTIALVMSYLSPSQAAALLWALPAETRADVSMRMASLEEVSPEITTKIVEPLAKKLLVLGESKRQVFGGIRAVADVLNGLNQAASTELLEKIQLLDPELAESIGASMFIFEDVVKVDMSGVRQVLARIDRKTLALALKGTSSELQDHFYDAMSQHSAEMMREDIDVLGPVRKKEVEIAQQQIIAAIRLLESEGVIDLQNDNASQYVE